jgi:hypothetical protein
MCGRHFAIDSGSQSSVLDEIAQQGAAGPTTAACRDLPGPTRTLSAMKRRRRSVHGLIDVNLTV